MTKVGFIGLGTMGRLFAANLAKAGFELVINDIDQQAVASFIEGGAIWAKSPADVAKSAPVVLTSLPGPKQVEAVALHPETGLIAGMTAESAVFDLSTNSPTMVRKIHAVMMEKGLHFLDAPVSGGPKGAASGKMAIWVGGDEVVFGRHRSALDAIADKVRYIGPIGAGSIAKLVHNASGYAIQCAVTEIFSAGVKAGIEPLALWTAIRQGMRGRQRTFDSLAAQFLINKYEPADFALDLAHKDVALAAELGRDVEVPMRLINMALAELTEARNRGWGSRDSRSFLLLQLERAGIEIAVDPELVRAAIEADEE